MTRSAEDIRLFIVNVKTLIEVHLKHEEEDLKFSDIKAFMSIIEGYRKVIQYIDGEIDD